MKAQIISVDTIDKLIDGTPCYITRINTSVQTNEDNSRVYFTKTFRAIYEPKNVIKKDANGDIVYHPKVDENLTPILDENGVEIPDMENPMYEQKDVLVIKEQKDGETSKRMVAEQINQFAKMLKGKLKRNFSETNRDLVLRANALLYLTINDAELPDGFMGTKNWKIV